LHRLHARWAGLARPATGFMSQPEPRSIGHYARGRQLVAGNFLFSGHLIEAPGLLIWDIAIPDPAFEDEVQGVAWLDDLAAVGDAAARRKAQDWTWGWIARFGRGTGPGWTPDLTGRRIIRWINHALFLLNGIDRTATEAYYRALSRQTVFLSRRWHTASPGLPRFEALTGQAAVDHLKAQEAKLLEAAAVLKAAPAEIVERLKALVEERKALQAEVANLRRDLAMGGKSGGPEDKEINGIKLIAQVMTGVSGKDLPSLIDEMKARIGSGAVVLIADTGAKPAVAAGVTADLTDRISAVTLAKAAVEALGGKGGGGRPDMAQGGGADIALADAALKAVEAALEA
jgi:uncharacterized heparinase superfamily protein